ncbi:MAG: acyltransferase [Aquihabitans sp.]
MSSSPIPPTDVFVHPQGLCESGQVGAGTRVWAFAHVLPGAVVGAGCNLGESTFVEGGAVLGDRVTIKNGVQVWDRVTIEDDVFVGPNATFTNVLTPRAFLKKGSEAFNPTVVRAGATIGANATIVCGTEIGPLAFVGAGAVVTRDVPAQTLVAGNPARPIGRVCRCAQRLTEDRSCPECGRRYDEAADGTLTEIS